VVGAWHSQQKHPRRVPFTAAARFNLPKLSSYQRQEYGYGPMRIVDKSMSELYAAFSSAPSLFIVFFFFFCPES
jgi:hypothetical protein